MYGQFTEEHFKKIREGLSLFDQGKYWECHEALEDAWMEDTQDNARYVIWSIIQAATAIYHYEAGNKEGMLGQMEKSLKKIQIVEERNVETDFLCEKIPWINFKLLVKEFHSEGSQIEKLQAFKFLEN